MISFRSDSSWNSWTRRGSWVLAIILICGIAGPKFVASLRTPRTTIVDFFQEWASARNYFTGWPIYADQRLAIERHLKSKLPKDAPFVLEVNAHPPTSVLLVLPFALLDYPNAFLVWNLFSLAALALSLWLIVRELNWQWSAWAILPLVALLLMCGPFRQQVNQGQLNLVLLLLLTGTWVADRRGWPFLAGTLLGAATVIKLFPAFLFLYFAVRGTWKSLVAGVTAGLLFTALTAGVLGPDVYREYFYGALPAVSLFRDWWANASLNGLWCKLFYAPSHHVEVLWSSPLLARAGTLISSLLLTVILIPQTRKARSRTDTDMAFGLTTVAMLLVSPITWDHYFLLLFPALAIIWARIGLPPLAGWILVGICNVSLIALAMNYHIYLMLCLLVPATAVWLWQAPSSSSARILALLCIILCVDPKIIWDVTIPGNDELHGGVAQPIHAITLLAYQCYTLLALFVLGLMQGRNSSSSEGVSNAEMQLHSRAQSADASAEEAQITQPFTESGALQLRGM